jgi:hypothetical protein
LQLRGPQTVALTTPGLSMSLGSVTSQKANNLTDNLWSATTGLPSDNLPEVPPDGARLSLPASTAPASVVFLWINFPSKPDIRSSMT